MIGTPRGGLAVAVFLFIGLLKMPFIDFFVYL